MNFLSNAHTHTPYCDGRSTIAEQVAAARSLGFVSLGFSGHAMQGFDWKYCMSVEGQRAYATELRSLQRESAENGLMPKLYVGLEEDSLVPAAEKAKNRAEFDYRIGSTHYFPETLHGEWVAMAEAYYTLHGATVERDRPDVIGHFDLVRKYAQQLGLDTGSAGYRSAALDALTQARRGCALLEVNTGGIARGYETAPFPAGFLLDAWREMGGEVTLTSDCHDARYLDCAFAETAVMLKSRGFAHALRLGTGDALWEEVAL